MIRQDPDAPPRKDACHNYCRLDTLEKMCCAAFQKEVRCALKPTILHWWHTYGLAADSL